MKALLTNGTAAMMHGAKLMVTRMGAYRSVMFAHNEGCEHQHLWVANCCEGNDLFLTYQTKDRIEQLREIDRRNAERAQARIGKKAQRAAAKARALERSKFIRKARKKRSGGNY